MLTLALGSALRYSDIKTSRSLLTVMLSRFSGVNYRDI